MERDMLTIDRKKNRIILIVNIDKFGL
jgi:hypothetical protein